MFKPPSISFMYRNNAICSYYTATRALSKRLSLMMADGPQAPVAARPQHLMSGQSPSLLNKNTTKCHKLSQKATVFAQRHLMLQGERLEIDNLECNRQTRALYVCCTSNVLRLSRSILHSIYSSRLHPPAGCCRARPIQKALEYSQWCESLHPPMGVTGAGARVTLAWCLPSASLSMYFYLLFFSHAGDILICRDVDGSEVPCQYGENSNSTSTCTSRWNGPYDSICRTIEA